MISEEEKLIATLATQMHCRWKDVDIARAVGLAIDIIKETKKTTRFSSKEREPVEDDNPYRADLDE